jgi:hypothetical protein
MILASARIINYNHKLRSKLKRNYDHKFTIMELLEYRPLPDQWGPTW